MKKNRLGKVAAVVLSLALVGTSFAFAGTEAPQKDSAKAQKAVVTAQAEQKISRDEAKAIFKKRVPNSLIKYLKKVNDDDFRGREVYKGKASKGSYVYDFEIDAATGRFVDFEKDYEGSRYSASKLGCLTKSQVMAKVKKRVPGAIIVYTKLTRDDGRYVYEGEAYRNGYTYEFEMNAFSGRYYDFEKEYTFDED